MRILVFSPPWMSGGVKSLYSVCEWLDELGRARIMPFSEPRLASWFRHRCELYDYSYEPEVLIYPEVFQPNVPGKYHVCCALGKYAPVQPHANLVVCRSREIEEWVLAQNPRLSARRILPSINRGPFEYDGRRKNDTICYMTRRHKHPETAVQLREAYGDRLVEIVDRTEDEVAEILRSAKVFVWRGNESEGSPRPPKEALVAGCVVVGLQAEMTEALHINFGVRCATEAELVRMAGEALDMPMPSEKERSVVRDGREEKQDWLALFKSLGIGRGLFTRPTGR